MPSKKRKYNARFPAGRIKKIMRIDDEIGKVALPVPVMISRALELFVSSLLVKAGDVTMQKSARTLTLAHLKQCIHSDSRLDFLKELVKSTPDHSEECNDIADPAVIQNNQVSNNDSDEETSSKTIEWHLLHGCACRLTNAEYRWLIAFPTECGALPSDTIVHLSALRLLLSMRHHRRQLQPVADSNYCPTVERMCLETLFSKTWFHRLLAMFASVDNYVRYVATCVATEVALGCAGSTGDLLVHLIDELMLTITTTMERSRDAAVNVLTRLLDVTGNNRRFLTVGTKFCCHNGDEAGRFTAVTNDPDIKTLLLDRLNAQWLDVINATVCENRKTMVTDYNSLADIVRLWTAVFRAFRSASSAFGNHGQFYSELPNRLEWLLYRTDTEPLMWLNTVRLFGASLHTCVNQQLDGRWAAERRTVARRALIGFTRRRLLYFMRKMACRFGLETNRTKVLLQETVLLAMRSLHVFVCGNNHLPDFDNGYAVATRMIRDVVDCLDSYVKATMLYATDVRFCRWIVRLMCDRDDATIECLTCALDVADTVSTAWPLLNPFAGFAELLECISYEPDVLLDYLISDESNFLQYILRVLKTVCRDSRCFFKSCGSGLDDVMGLLIRLRLKMLRLHENHVFPYNVEPIAKLIQRCDELYTEIVL